MLNAEFQLLGTDGSMSQIATAECHPVPGQSAIRATGSFEHTGSRGYAHIKGVRYRLCLDGWAWTVEYFDEVRTLLPCDELHTAANFDLVQPVTVPATNPTPPAESRWARFLRFVARVFARRP